MNLQDKKIFKVNIVYTPTNKDFEIVENGYIIVDSKGLVEKVVKELPTVYADHPIYNYGNKIIIPGLTDLHIHSGQYTNRGLCLDKLLMDWLLECIYPTEAKFRDIDFAKMVYSKFINNLWKSGNLRSVVYDTIFADSTKLLIDMFITSGMSAIVGKASMDRNAPDYIIESTKQALKNTEEFIIQTINRSKLVKPAIYPRFIPTCSIELMRGLGELALKYQVPVISHLSESKVEVSIVKEQYPNFSTYADIYNHFGLLGKTPTVMAHAVYSNERERELLKNNGVWVANSPNSNLNLGSGMMKTRYFIDEGIKLGIGSDIGANANLSILESMRATISVSKVVGLYSDEKIQPVKVYEAFYMGTKGGGSFFGKVGSFEPGYEFDALVLDDSRFLDIDYTLRERIERFIYIGTDEDIVTRFISGREIPEPIF